MQPTLDLIRQATIDTPFEGEVWLVGGAVRDMLMGNPPQDDLDLVTELSSAELAHLLFEKGVSEILPVTYPRFGTAMIRVKGFDVELVTARRESYSSESRKPITEPATLQDDALRRDFTVNALFLNIHTNEIRDPLGSGFGHIVHKILQTPLNPDDTFIDDPLRMLRAIRFRWKLDFEPAEGLYESIRFNRERLNIISLERIRDELLKMLIGPNPSGALNDLLATGLIEQFAPELAAMKGVDQGGGYHHLDVWDHTLLALKNAKTQAPVLAVAILFHDTGKPSTKFIDDQGNTRFFGHETVSAEIARTVMSRLKFPNADIDAVCLLVKNHMRLMSASKVSASAARRLIRDLGDNLDRLLDLAEADISALKPGVDAMDIPELREHLVTATKETPKETLDSPLKGAEIMALLNLKPGKEVGRIKSQLSDMVIEGQLDFNDKNAAKQAAIDLHSREPNDEP